MMFSHFSPLDLSLKFSAQITRQKDNFIRREQFINYADKPFS